MLPLGSEVVVMEGAVGRLTRMLRTWVALCGGLLESATLSVKLVVPLGPVGVPVIAPVAVFKFRPAGKLPTFSE